MSGLVSRSGRDALPEERGAGLRRDPVDPVPKELRHDPERIDDHDGRPFDRCRHCGREDRPSGISPFAECPARELPSDVEERADAAEADDRQGTLVGARTDSMVGVPSR